MYRILFLLILCFPSFLSGQNKYYLQVNETDTLDAKNQRILSFNSKGDVDKYLQKLWSKTVKRGFVLASIDSVVWENDTAYVSFYKGELFNAIQITYKPGDHIIIKKTPRISERLLSHLPFEPHLVEKTLRSIGDYLNNTGYPFAKVYLTVDTISPEISTAQLHIEKGPLMKILKIHLKGSAKVKEKFIQSAISIKEGDIYSAEVLRNISLKIEQIQFVKEMRKHELLFTADGAEIYLYLEGIPVSTVNGIVGLQPDPITSKTMVTGEVRLKLLNILSRGEELKLEWRSLQPKTQNFNVKLNYPFLFNTPFGVEGRFDLYKLDSTYLTMDAYIAAHYYLSGGSYVKVFYQNNNSNLLSGASSLPNMDLSTLSTNRYGIGLFKTNIDYLPNPSKGLTIAFDFAAGKRKSTAPKESDTEQKETTKSSTFLSHLEVEWFLPIFSRRHVLRLTNVTSSYIAPEIYRNELYRFGGLITQRGFNEETLFATTATTFSIEYRFLVDKNSHAFAFFDQSIYENNSSVYTKDTPFGFGLGFSFGTKIGVFSISYAMGKQFDNAIRFKDGKIHFGYVAYF